MTKRRAAKTPPTPGEISAAIQALGLNIPVRSAERKGKQIVLHTRNGDYAWTPKVPERAASPRKGRDEPTK